MKKIISCLVIMCLLISNSILTGSAQTVTKDNADIVIKVGEKYTLEAVLRYLSEHNVPPNVPIKWETSNAKIATVSNGVVTGVKEGGVTIKASAVDKGVVYQAEANVFVMSTVTGVRLNASNLNLKVGQTETLVETVIPNTAIVKSVTWKSSDTKVATVSNGKVKGVGDGYADITVTTKDGEHIAQCRVNVESTVTGVSLDAHTLTKTVGEEFSLSAKVLPENAFLKDVKWITSNSKVVSVSNGKLKALSKGEATITVETIDGKFTDSCKVTVASMVTGITLNKTELTIVKGNKEALSAIITPGDAVEKGVVWSSENKKIATVDKDGVVTGVSEGNVKISAVTKDGNIEAICYVTVVSYDIKPESIDLIDSEITMNFGETRWLTFKVSPANAVVPKLKAAITAIGDSKAVPVSIIGNAVYLEVFAAGNYILTLSLESDPNIKDTCYIHVKSMVTGIRISREKLEIYVGQKITLTGSALPDTAIIKGVVWRSSNPKVAKVDTMTGEVEGVLEGTCNIVAMTIDGGLEKNCNVVVKNPVDVKDLQLKDANGNIIGEMPVEDEPQGNDDLKTDETQNSDGPDEDGQVDAGVENGGDGPKITIDGVLLETDQEPVIVEGRTLAPMRVIFEALGAEVFWDGELEMATGSKDGTVIQLFINKKTALLNGKPVELDVPAQLVGGRTMVPVRFIAESLGVDVDWIPETKTVVIITEK